MRQCNIACRRPVLLMQCSGLVIAHNDAQRICLYVRFPFVLRPASLALNAWLTPFSLSLADDVLGPIDQLLKPSKLTTLGQIGVTSSKRARLSAARTRRSCSASTRSNSPRPRRSTPSARWAAALRVMRPDAFACSDICARVRLNVFFEVCPGSLCRLAVSLFVQEHCYCRR